VRTRIFVGSVAVILVGLTAVVVAETDVEDQSTAIATRSRESVVVVLSTGRQGTRAGLGTGFVIRSDGVIATNFHVIGEHRPFSIQFANGDVLEPTAILGYDRKRDLALVKVDAQNLKALDLGDSSLLRPGQTVMALGNPLGLEYSVTRGVIASTSRVVGEGARGREMIQIGIPIEPGSSGSPVLNLDGRVVGILAMKSSDAFGFAEPVNHLKELLDRKLEIPMPGWLTIGALDQRDWSPLAGGLWRQRGGTIVAEGKGDGFAGRMLCLSKLSCPPDQVFALEVDVRLDDEGGAAGLAFHSDGSSSHYGFYPTNGALRLTRFEGPDVFSWTILNTVNSSAYRRNEWNRIGVQVDGRRISCSVNGEVVIEKEDHGLEVGRIGLVKFRDPGASFRRFRIGKIMGVESVSDETRASLEHLLGEVDAKPDDDTLVDRIATVGQDTVALLEAKSVEREQEAERLRVLAARVHERLVALRFGKLIADGDAKIDLLRGALFIALLDNPDLDVAAYERLVDRMAQDIEKHFDPNAPQEKDAVAAAEARRDALVLFMFEEQGFHASVADYYHRSNSYINEVLDDREGIPITLSLVFIELGRRLGLQVSGMNTPRHFLVRHDLPGGTAKFIDVFNSAREVNRAEIAALSGKPMVRDSDLVPAKNAAVLARILRNLIAVAESQADEPAVMRYLNAIIAIQPDSAVDRWVRAVRLYRAQKYRRAAIDLDWLLEKVPAGVDLQPIHDMRKVIRERLGEA
jgi:serine protease Do